MYLIAKIDNCSLYDVTNINGLQNIEAVPLTAGLSFAQETALRAIPDAEVTTFDHIPFVGLRKMTDPTGKVTYYEHNLDGKLELIRNNDGNPLKRYIYSIENTGYIQPNQ